MQFIKHSCCFSVTFKLFCCRKDGIMDADLSLIWLTVWTDVWTWMHFWASPYSTKVVLFTIELIVQWVASDCVMQTFRCPVVLQPYTVQFVEQADMKIWLFLTVDSTVSYLVRPGQRWWWQSVLMGEYQLKSFCAALNLDTFDSLSMHSTNPVGR